MKKNRFIELAGLFSRIRATDKAGRARDPEKAVEDAAALVYSRKRKGGKVIVVGNGGSSSIASHIATDLIKNLGIPALAFTDASLLTCLSNDLGYENVFSAPIGVMAGKKDILFAISSSGRSKNILKAVSEARRKGCSVIGFSGFAPGNPLRRMGDINFYVPSSSYGAVEIAHLAVCHFIVDILYAT